MRVGIGLVICLLVCTVILAGGGCAERQRYAAEPNSPNGPVWHLYNGHRYALTETSGSWDAAQAGAAGYGGNLVTIDTAEENDWLVLTFGPQWLWIGLSQAPGAVDPASPWGWASGDVSAYRSWAAGQPDNHSGVDNCAMINVEDDLGRWHDVPAEGWPPDSPGKRGIIEIALQAPDDAGRGGFLD